MFVRDTLLGGAAEDLRAGQDAHHRHQGNGGQGVEAPQCPVEKPPRAVGASVEGHREPGAHALPGEGHTDNADGQQQEQRWVCKRQEVGPTGIAA